jgi:hypothetical protein
MTIDVEDYFQVEAFASTIDRRDWDRLPQRVERNTERILDILAASGAQATRFLSSTAGVVSSYRRPLPAANLGFLSTIMWDGREPSLFSQAVDATLGHAQASAPPPMRNSSRS